MRVLYLAHRIPFPPNKGDKIRAFHEIRGLAERGHAVDLLAFADDPADLARAVGLRPYCASCAVLPLDTRTARLRSVAAMAGRKALSLAYFRERAMFRAVAGVLDRFPPETCVAYSSPMAQYIPLRMQNRSLMDLVDVDSEKWRDYSLSHGWPMSLVYRVEWRRLRALELSVVRQFGRTVLATEREASLLRSKLPADASARLHSLVNGVDTRFFRPAVNGQAPGVGERERPFFGPGGPRVVFTGAMDYHANVEAVTWFVSEAWPEIRSVHPEARFLIVGSRPTTAVYDLAKTPGVEVTGFVEDVRPYLWSADACVVPLAIARGIQNKLLEAMACGKPVVTTPDAVAALAVRSGEQVLVAHRNEDFARTVLRVLTDKEGAQRIAARGREYVERRHSWTHMLDQFCGLVEGLAGKVEV